MPIANNPTTNTLTNLLSFITDSLETVDFPARFVKASALRVKRKAREIVCEMRGQPPHSLCNIPNCSSSGTNAGADPSFHFPHSRMKWINERGSHLQRCERLGSQ